MKIQFLIITKAGKLVWSYNAGSASESMVQLAGLVQTLVLFYEDEGSMDDRLANSDSLKTVKSSNGKLVYMFKDIGKCLYFVAIGDGSKRSRPNYPSISPHLVARILDLLRLQIQFVLTEFQIVNILNQNQNYDLSRLLVGMERYFDQIVNYVHKFPFGCSNSSKTYDLNPTIPFFFNSTSTLKLPKRFRDALTSVIACMDLNPNPNEIDSNSYTLSGRSLSKEELIQEQDVLYTLIVTTKGQLVALYNGSGIIAVGRCSYPNKDNDSSIKDKSIDSYLNSFQMEELCNFTEFISKNISNCTDPLNSDDLLLLLNLVLSNVNNDYQQNWIPCCLPNLDSNKFVYLHYSFVDILSSNNNYNYTSNNNNNNNNNNNSSNEVDDDDDIMDLINDNSISDRNIGEEDDDDYQEEKKVKEPKLCIIQITKNKNGFYHLSRRFKHILLKLKIMEKHGILSTLNESIVESNKNNNTILLKDILKSQKFNGIRNFIYIKNPNHSLGCTCITTKIINTENSFNINYMADITNYMINNNKDKDTFNKDDNNDNQQYKILSLANQNIKNKMKSFNDNNNDNKHTPFKYGTFNNEIILDNNNQNYNQNICKCPCIACRNKWPPNKELSITSSISNLLNITNNIYNSTSLPFLNKDDIFNKDLYINKLSKSNLSTNIITQLNNINNNQQDQQQKYFELDNYNNNNTNLQQTIEPNIINDILIKQLFKHRINNNKTKLNFNDNNKLELYKLMNYNLNLNKDKDKDDKEINDTKIINNILLKLKLKSLLSDNKLNLKSFNNLSMNNKSILKLLNEENDYEDGDDDNNKINKNKLLLMIDKLFYDSIKLSIDTTKVILSATNIKKATELLIYYNNKSNKSKSNLYLDSIDNNNNSNNNNNNIDNNIEFIFNSFYIPFKLNDQENINLFKWFLSSYGNLRPIKSNYNYKLYKNNQLDNDKDKNNLSKEIKKPYYLLPSSPPTLCSCNKITRECIISNSIRPKGIKPFNENNSNNNEDEDENENEDDNEDEDEEFNYKNLLKLNIYTSIIELSKNMNYNSIIIQNQKELKDNLSKDNDNNNDNNESLLYEKIKSIDKNKKMNEIIFNHNLKLDKNIIEMINKLYEDQDYDDDDDNDDFDFDYENNNDDDYYDINYQDNNKSFNTNNTNNNINNININDKEVQEIEPNIIINNNKETIILININNGILIINVSPKNTLKHINLMLLKLINWIQLYENDLFIF